MNSKDKNQNTWNSNSSSHRIKSESLNGDGMRPDLRVSAHKQRSNDFFREVRDVAIALFPAQPVFWGFRSFWIQTI
jgi:hypothetical protein